LTLIKLLIVAWVPGAALFRSPFLDREKRAALDAEERLFWAVILSLAISLSLVIAMAAAHRYSFNRLLIADLAIAAAVALASKFDLRLGPTARRPGLTALLPIALILLGLWRFFPSSEYVMGGKDPGTYINEGIQIAQRGTLVFNDPVVSSIPELARPLFFPPNWQASVYSIRFMGFFIRNPDTGAVVGQFPHLFPASIAIGHALDGLTGARRTTGAWAILGLLAVYFAGARLVGRTAAWAAAALLGLHVIQVWFARYPNAEVVMQALLFAALLANARAHIDRDRFFAPVAGALLGLLIFLRVDAVLAIGAVVAATALAYVSGDSASASATADKRLRWTFVATLAITSSLATVYLFGLMRAYADLPVVFLSNLLPWQYAALAAAAALGIGLVVAGTRSPAVKHAIRQFTPHLLTLAVVAGALYALFLRQQVLFVLADRDASALRTFTNFYLTLPALLAALVGFVLLARRAFWRAPDLFVTVTVFAFFYFYKIRIASDHFWMTRRFLAVILPGALLFACAAALSGARGGFWVTRVVRGAIGIAFVLLLAGQYMRATRPILPHIEYEGLIPRLEALAQTIGDRDLLIVESRNATDTHVLGLPLAYIYDRSVITLASPLPDKALFTPFLEWARTRYARVLFMGGGGTDLLSPAWDAKAIAGERFQIPEYDAPVDAYPRFVRHKEFDFSIYELTPPDPAAASRPFDLDVGFQDDLHVVRFHAKEQTEGRTIRWSRGTSYVGVTNIRPDSRAVVLTLSNGGRPVAAGPADLTVSLDDQVLGTVRVAQGFKPYALQIPPALAQAIAARGQPVRLKLASTVWVPFNVLGTGDDGRDLGIMVDRVAIE
jgi:hypothetical protein